MKQPALNFVNNSILRQASKLDYLVSDIAPNTEKDLFNSSNLIIWAGASENTIYKDPKVNWAFRALHDYLHLKTGLDFSIDAEIELARIQACQYTSKLLQDLVYCEIAIQALHFKKTGQFVNNQIEFTTNWLKSKGNLE